MANATEQPRGKGELIGRLVWGAALVASVSVAVLGLRHWVDARYRREGIVVSGSATQRITSDRAIWSASVHARGATVAEAYAILERDVPRVRQFLLDNHVAEGDVHVDAVDTDELYAYDEDGNVRTEQIVGYSLTQSVRVTSSDVELVGRVARDVTQLIQSGALVVSGAPEYIHSDLGEIKIRLVGEATADARARAAQVAEHSGATLGSLLSANVGVVQVNAANETSVSWEGVYDRSSVEKDVMVVVRTVFELE
ncbi:SIMPL domain-containing protein [Sandaracinus amylolyticus]|uniref:SIMPL domain-containing protein n=1 Tax=Sandaracinus amylolyticus TaxID=927083 RepID=UPI001F3EFDCE|nr:SIMPL domain-containing protein [Sandaracinus amylolyticus]UJR79804.1 Hypothetical protein I5071_18420 [Sandaracinus amylolyticus]